MIGFRWTCPDCRVVQTVDQAHCDDQRFLLRAGASRHGPLGLKVVSVTCRACGALSAAVALHRAAYPEAGGFVLQEELTAAVLTV